MNLGEVMDEIGDRLDTIAGLRVYRFPPDNVQPPAAVVTYPDSYMYHQTFRNGMDRIERLPVVVMVGKVSDRASRDQITKWVGGDGVQDSIKDVLEASTYTSLDALTVTDVEFDIVSMAGVEYLAATFHIDIAGAA